MYFKNMPIVSYNMGGYQKLARNILVCAKFNDFFAGKDKEQLFVDYKIRDGETPEELAYRVYDNAELHWIILLFNNLLNPYFEWPLSQSQMEAELYAVYPGSAIFVDITSSFNKTNGIQLSTSKSQFVPGAVIGHENGYWTGIIKSWNTTFRKLEITDIEGVFTSDIISSYTGKVVSINPDGVEFEANMKRVVFDNTYALHHFEDSDGEYVDPYQDFVGRTLADSNESALSGDFILKRYIEESYDTDVIVNRAYEDFANDIKRDIKILKVEYVQSAIDTYISIFNG